MALAVIVLSPLFDDDFGLLQAVEDFTVEQLIPEAGVEALAVAVLPGRTRRYVGSLGAHGADPVPNLFSDKLWAHCPAGYCAAMAERGYQNG